MYEPNQDLTCTVCLDNLTLKKGFRKNCHRHRFIFYVTNMYSRDHVVIVRIYIARRNMVNAKCIVHSNQFSCRPLASASGTWTVTSSIHHRNRQQYPGRIQVDFTWIYVASTLDSRSAWKRVCIYCQHLTLGCASDIRLQLHEQNEIMNTEPYAMRIRHSLIPFFRIMPLAASNDVHKLQFFVKYSIN